MRTEKDSPEPNVIVVVSCNKRITPKRCRASGGLHVLFIVIGIVLSVLITAAAWGYSRAKPRLDRYDRMGACIFFIVIGLPTVIVSLILIADYFVGVA